MKIPATWPPSDKNFLDLFVGCSIFSFFNTLESTLSWSKASISLKETKSEYFHYFKWKLIQACDIITDISLIYYIYGIYVYIIYICKCHASSSIQSVIKRNLLMIFMNLITSNLVKSNMNPPLVILSLLKYNLFNHIQRSFQRHQISLKFNENIKIY